MNSSHEWSRPIFLLNLHIGNDVVDLESDEARSLIENERFMRRVFTVGERETIGRSSDPLRAAWTIWAAKEAAYKVALKGDPRLPFAHSRFEVDLDASSVRSLGTEVGLRIEATKSYVHVVALSCAPLEVTKIVHRVERCPIADSAMHAKVLSEAVRRLAVEMLEREFDLTDARITRSMSTSGRLGPPEIYEQDRLVSGLSLSLSHHENWVAAAISNRSAD